MSEEKAHSPLGASVSERYINCPGSVQLVPQAPPAMPSKYAAEGTVAHKVAEKRLLGALHRVDAVPMLGDKLSADGFTFEVTEEMIDAVELYVNTILDLAKDYGISEANIKAETELHIPCDFSDDLWGTADNAMYAPYRIAIFTDFKYGAGTPVDVLGNTQLLFYALGGFYSLPKDERSELDSVLLVVIQPRVGKQVQMVEYTIAELMEFKEILFAAVLEINAKSERRVPGKWCQWCPAKLICPEKIQYLADEALVQFKDIPPDGAITPPVVTELTDDQINRALKARKPLKEFLKAIEAEAFRRAMENPEREIGDFEIVQAEGRTKWKDDAISLLEKGLGGVKLFTRLELVSITEAKKIAKKEKLDLRFELLTEKPNKGAALAPKKLGNKKLTGAAVFEGIEADE